MKINVNESIKNFSGDPVKISEDSKEVLTIKDVLMNYLGRFSTDNGKDNITAYDLGTRLYKSKEFLELSPDEFVFLKDKVCDPSQKYFTALVMGQLMKNFDEVDK